MKHSPAPTSLLGFTLVELLIAVSLMAILTAATIPNFSAFIVSQNLKQANEQVKNGIRDVQNRAMTGINAGATYTYWVIRFTNGSSSYQIGKTTSANPGASDCATLASIDEVSNPLQGGTVFSVAGGGSSNACIFYKMLAGDAVGVNLSSLQVAVKLNGACKAVKINSSGLVKGIESLACPS